MEQRDLIAAIATGAGVAAVGIVRLSGPGIPALFQPLLGRASLAPRKATFCRFLQPGGEALDEGLALYFPAPASYTGQDVLELQGHGGQAVLESVLMRCLELGARPAQPGEFTYRAYLNGRLDLVQAEAVADLIEAKSAAAARSAVRALSGDFSKRIEAIVAEVIRLRVLAEAYLDFPEEEDVGFFEREGALERIQGIASRLTALKRSARRSQLLRGARVVLAGEPNVGKSSLLNRLAGEDVAIVTPLPGTTRDVVRATLQLDGIAVELLDTAGLRSSADPIEQIGIERTRSSMEDADLVLRVRDCSIASSPEAVAVPAGIPVLEVLNKADLLPESDVQQRATSEGRGDGVYVSARSGAGLGALRQAISNALGLGELQEGVFLARERHIGHLDVALRHVEAAIECSDVLLLAEELRLAQRALGEITGTFTTEDLLGAIFSEFCIGK